MDVDPDKAINCVADTGNNGNALPFLQLEMLVDRMTEGQKALGVAIESSKWIKGGIALQN
jgi:3-oxoacyl-[acyl-carrier-protein] synthase-3